MSALIHLMQILLCYLSIKMRLNELGMRTKPYLKSILLVLSFLSLLHNNVLAEIKTIGDYKVEEHVSGLNYPWSMAFVSDNHYLVTEKAGALRQVINKQVKEPVVGLPNDIYVKGQGGLLDVVLHPEYLLNKWIYLSYSAGDDKHNTLKVIRGKIRDNKLVDVQSIFSVAPTRDTPVHYGARLAFMSDNTLLISSGDGFDFREDAQRLDNHLGKILRVNEDGGLPDDNPFALESGLRKWVYSIGHRNPQGLVVDQDRNRIISHEHGPAGGDEINIIRSGKNYGWPVITYGKDYIGASISPFKEYPGMQQPWVDWTPSIAPSDMTIYKGTKFPQMRGDLLVSTLKTREIRWIQMAGNQIVHQTSLFSELNQRIRGVKVHPDGSILLLIDDVQGKILRVVPSL